MCVVQGKTVSSVDDRQLVSNVVGSTGKIRTCLSKLLMIDVSAVGQHLIKGVALLY